MSLKHWVREKGAGYCYGPEEEMYHETDIECEPQPTIDHKWVDSKWVLDKELENLRLKNECKNELMRTDRFMVIDTQLSITEMVEAKKYRQDLRDLIKNPCPEFLQDK